MAATPSGAGGEIMLDGALLSSDNRQESAHLPQKGATPRHLCDEPHPNGAGALGQWAAGPCHRVARVPDPLARSTNVQVTGSTEHGTKDGNGLL
jgi:hypothetical protein